MQVVRHRRFLTLRWKLLALHWLIPFRGHLFDWRISRHSSETALKKNQNKRPVQKTKQSGLIIFSLGVRAYLENARFSSSNTPGRPIPRRARLPRPPPWAQKKIREGKNSQILKFQYGGRGH